MNFNIGDRVRFLTEKGGGVVVKVKNSSIVVVRTDDDFDIPYHIRDLVKIEHQGTASDFFKTKEEKERESATTPKAPPAPVEPDSYEDDRLSKIAKYKNRSPLPEGVYLAWMPQDQKTLVSGYIDLYLVNDTKFDILFSLLLQSEGNQYTGMDYDAVPSHQKTLLKSFDRDRLEFWSAGIVQMLFHANKMPAAIAPISASFKVSPSRFYKEENYKEYEILENRAFVYELTKASFLHSVYESDEKNTEYGKISGTTIAAKHALPDPFLKKHLIASGEAIIDLHIEALTDNYQKMQDHEKLNYQIRYFERCLDDAVAYNIRKITFIHGIGHGILRKELIDKLNEYPNIVVQDAPLRQFGKGAIEVRIFNTSQRND